jgi:hypothetical protein
MAIYTKEDDKKLAQDNVMMLAMLAFGARVASQSNEVKRTASKAPPPPRKGRVSASRKRRH